MAGEALPPEVICGGCLRAVWAHAPGCARPDPTAHYTAADHAHVLGQWRELNKNLRRLNEWEKRNGR